MAKSELLRTAVSSVGNEQSPAQSPHDSVEPRSFVPTTQGTSCGRAPTRTSATHHETSDTYTGVIAQLCPRHRVIICKDAIQWILQRRDTQRAGRPRWTGIGYFRTRSVLIAVSRTVCARIDPNAMAILAALPGTIGGAS
jgi:hypothetical protein